MSCLLWALIDGLKVEVGMMAAARIEIGLASGASVSAAHVVFYAQFTPARTAEYCRLVPFCTWPDLNRMVRQCFMAVFARVINAATLHPDCDDVRVPVVMSTACLGIQANAAHDGVKNRHINRVKDWKLRLSQMVRSSS
jgi:hypothetical protein